MAQLLLLISLSQILVQINVSLHQILVQINVSLHQILVQINVISINSSAKKHNRKASLATDLQQNRGHVAHDLQQKFIAIATD